MIFSELDITIKDYLGRMGPGIVVALSILYKNKVYEGMYWYTETDFIIEIPDEIEEVIGTVEQLDEHDVIIKYLQENTADYLETIPKMSDIFEEG